MTNPATPSPADTSETRPATHPNHPATPSESLETPSAIPSESLAPTRKRTRATLRAQARIAIVAQIIREHGSVPTHLGILNELRCRGVKSSKGTVLNDLAALGLSEAPTAYAHNLVPVEPSDF